MGGKRTTKEELTKLESLTEEGLTTREIAQGLGRSEAAIRNLRYKRHIVAKAENNIKALSEERDRLSGAVERLKEEKRRLESEVHKLEWQKFKAELMDPEHSKRASFTLFQTQQQINPGKDKNSLTLNL